MQQVKLFKGVETELSGLEQEVNDWIRESGARVTNITGNIAPQSGSLDGPGQRRYPPSDLLLIVVYETP